MADIELSYIRQQKYAVYPAESNQESAEAQHYTHSGHDGDGARCKVYYAAHDEHSNVSQFPTII